MKKVIIGVLLVGTFVVGCSVKSQAESEKSSYIEAVDKYNTFNLIKVVDKETGCKYLITNLHDNAGNTRPSAPVQMFNSNGKPVCN